MAVDSLFVWDNSHLGDTFVFVSDDEPFIIYNNYIAQVQVHTRWDSSPSYSDPASSKALQRALWKHYAG